MGSLHFPNVYPIQGRTTAPDSPPDAIDGTDYYVWFNQTTQRLGFINEDADEYYLPTFSLEYADIGAAYVPVVNDVGGFDSTPLLSVANPLIDLSGFPIGVRWPQGNVRVGDAPVVTGSIAETAKDGVTAVNRAVITMTPVEQCVAEGVSINLNTTTAQILYTNDTTRKFTPTRIVAHDATISLVGLGYVSIGTTGAAYNDFVAAVLLTGMTTANHVRTIYPDDAVIRLDPTGAIRWKNSAAIGSADTVKADVFGYYSD